MKIVGLCESIITNTLVSEIHHHLTANEASTNQEAVSAIHQDRGVTTLSGVDNNAHTEVQIRKEWISLLHPMVDENGFENMIYGVYQWPVKTVRLEFGKS